VAFSDADRRRHSEVTVTRSAAEVRQQFIDFFREKHGHVFVPSSPVVPHDDPTLLFTNAGMNQFKPYFLGTARPTHTRVANTQKCIRAGGKHNDLDDVGHDTYHHTFFEMLGNWSFGDYFKKEAIAWAWELLTDVWGLDPERLHATYFEGDEAEGLAPDLEARDLWRAILPPERVHPGNKKDNFWEMGETGPCGPCSEVHIDLTPDKSGARLVNTGDARAIEIWNLVFIQFNRGPDGRLTPLPARHVDTGMGFERVTALLQGKSSNYDTDVFTPIFAAIHDITGAPPYAGTLEQATDGADQPARDPAVLRDVAYRVIADHARCLTFALTDGAVPDKEGRGYVLRRILRRAVRYGWQYLDMHQPFLHKLVPTIVTVMGAAFPELKKRPEQVAGIIREEEESFGHTLERGIALFEEAAETASRHHQREIRGQDAFKLHDTYGFPIDLTQIMADERGLRVDIAEYERLMDEARERARQGGKGVAGRFGHVPADLLSRFGPTDSAAKYEVAPLSTDVRAIVRFDQSGMPAVLSQPGEHIGPGDEAGIICARTCFYAEAGGQIGDCGVIGGDALRFDVEDTQQIGDIVVHWGTLVQGQIAVGQEVTLTADPHRTATMQNHTATHVLNWALRRVLGDHVQQRGSLVDAEKTRFDFAHPRAMTPAEIERVEALVNEQIRRDLPIYYQVVPQAEALKINGLRAVFGERYPDLVRVMSIGVPVNDLLAKPDNPQWQDYSIEFCGGTHLSRTRDIQHFILTSEEAVAKGIRRVVGITGQTAQLADEFGAALVAQAEELRDGPPENVSEELPQLQNTLLTAVLPQRHRLRLNALLAELQKIVKAEEKDLLARGATLVKDRLLALLPNAPRIGDTTVLVAEMPDAPAEQLKHGVDIIKQKCGSAAILLGMRTDDKATLLAAMTDDLVKRGLKAGDLVKAVAKLVSGGGGGPPTMAQAGGKDPAKLLEALEAGRAWINERL
jgi:alanyl-tRNA synthetase